MRRLLSWLQQWFIFIDDTSSNARCSIDVVVFSRPSVPGGSFLVLSSGQSCKALPVLVWAFLVLSPLLLVWSCIKWGLLCCVFRALLVLGHFLRRFFPRLVQAIQVDLQLIVVATFLKKFSFHVGDSNFNYSYCFSSIGEFKWCLSN